MCVCVCVYHCNCFLNSFPIVNSSEFAALDTSKVREEELFMHRYVYVCVYLNIHCKQLYCITVLTLADTLSRRLLLKPQRRRKRRKRKKRRVVVLGSYRKEEMMK